MTPEPGNLPPRHRPPGQVAERPAAVRDLLAAHAAARERTADQHMFTVSSWNGARMGTFRLQLFTAPGTRPVAVATQGPLLAVPSKAGKPGTEPRPPRTSSLAARPPTR
jgi:hypothetical protein